MSTHRVVLVSFVGPLRRIDAAADADTPLRSLLGPVQALLGVDLGESGPSAPVVRLLPAGDPTGTRAADLGRSLATLGAVDGDVVSLFPWTPGEGAGALAAAGPLPADVEDGR